MNWGVDTTPEYSCNRYGYTLALVHWWTHDQADCPCILGTGAYQ